jgi:hypothetical protein
MAPTDLTSLTCFRRKTLISLMTALLFTGSCQRDNPRLLYQCEAYSVYCDSVVQPPYKALIRSPYEIFSDYQSPLSGQAGSRLQFKFSINSRDNEMPMGINHEITLQPVSGEVVTGPVAFGKQYTDTIRKPVTVLPVNTKWTVQLDMNEMITAFKEKGRFRLCNGSILYPSDFKGVYIAGNTEPLSWDFENLCNNKSFELKDDDHDGIYSVTLVLNPPAGDDHVTTWKLNTDVSGYPAYKSDQLIVDALYNMSLEEMIKDIRTDSTFMAGAKWNGVWTRDISYSIFLSLALMNPEVSKNSLLRKVRNKRIIQDTGTGGSWPVSTDRTTWALAAWELYKVTGDHDWLLQAYEIIKNSVTDDQLVAFDRNTGLMYGESSFLDWREQSYPKWMGPVDIFESRNLGTNAVHYQTYMMLAEMASILGLSSDDYLAKASLIRKGINKYLWLDDQGFYGQFLYGKNLNLPSPRSEALGEALTVLFDIADTLQQKKIIARTPVTTFGIPCIFPQIPDIKPYHNNAVWPFVEAFWTLASAKAGNEVSVVHGLGSVYRQASLFLTNKENMVADNGDFKGTAINSDRQLWSVAGNIAMIYKLFLGIDLKPDGIYFQPFIPKAYRGLKTLSGLHYRDMTLDIAVKGYGNIISSFLIDGRIKKELFLPSDLKGHHSIEIVMDNREPVPSDINVKMNEYVPFPSGYPVKKPGSAVDSFFSALSDKHVVKVEAESAAPVVTGPYKGFSGKGYVELTKTKNKLIKFNVRIDEAGSYVIDFRYSNGSGPVNTDNKCAMRTLKNGDEMTGTVIFPQLGKDEWSNWGYSNILITRLKKGENHLTLSFEPFNENMNGEVNTAMLDFIRITPVGKE